MSEEQVLFIGPSSAFVNLWSYIIGGAVLAGSIVMAMMISEWFFALAGLAFLYVVLRWLVNRCRVYEVTTERIRLRTGIFTRRTDELELYRVQDITLIEPLLERLFGVGSIKIATMDESTPSLTIESIRGAASLREQLRKHVEICRERKRVRIAELEGESPK